MLFKFSSRPSRQRLVFSSRYFTRLVLLAGLCVVAMIALAMPALRERSPGKSGAGAMTHAGTIQTAIAPSPFGELGQGVIVADDQPKTLGETLPEMPLSNAQSAESLPAVDQRILQHVLDKTSDRSKRPFYHLLTLAATAPPDRLERHARRDVTYAQLWNEPEKFRGELIYLKGYLRGLQPWQATESAIFNPAEIQTLYDGYLLSEDSRPNPYVIVLPRVAAGMPTGSNIAENVTFAGYFFKLWRYQAADGTERAAPLLVGQMLTWTPAPQQERYTHLSGYLAAAFVLLVMSLGAVLWAINRRQLRRASALNAAPTADRSVLLELEQLEQFNLPDPTASLDQNRIPTDGPKFAP